jgi:tryptophan-rich sensory protein
VICLFIAGIEGWVTVTYSNQWYINLQKPWFNPPAYVFTPVWSVLYITIAIAGGLIFSERKAHPRLLFYFFIQLIFNFLWSILFFCFQSIAWALIDILLLWLTLFMTLFIAFRHYKTVGYWLLAYFFWVSFAMILNFSLWILN